jgi:hypothetical protein
MQEKETATGQTSHAITNNFIIFAWLDSVNHD